MTVVLPAEYAVDPIGTGRWLGLTEIASPSLTPVETVSPDGAVLAPVQNGPVGEYPAEFKLDVFEIALQPYEYVEYKYHLEQGATMLYSWTASAAVIHDLHGERASGAGNGVPRRRALTNRTAGKPAGALPHRLPAFTGGTGRIPAVNRSPFG